MCVGGGEGGNFVENVGRGSNSKGKMKADRGSLETGEWSYIGLLL